MLPLLFLTAANPAHAGEVPVPMHFIGRYDFTWTGISIAAAELEISETKNHYALRVGIGLQGIASLFTRHRSDTTVTGRREGDSYFPEVYESHYLTKNKPRHIKIVYDRKGVVTEDTVDPPEDRSLRPEVPHALRDGTIDPLTLLRVVPQGAQKPHVFDAKHLYEGIAVKNEPVGIRLSDGIRPSQHYTLSRKPLAGMTQKELKDYAKGEPQLQFYFSDDARHIPLYAAIPIYLGNLRGSLTKECRTWDECRVY